jgi:putative serine/threonine protein kinase
MILVATRFEEGLNRVDEGYVETRRKLKAVPVIQTSLAIEELIKEPYAWILCYPRPSSAEIKRRIEELQRLDVTAIEFVGEKHVFNVPVLGKGCVGIVVRACRHEARVALKIRRVDADRTGMQEEARLLREANMIHVGPNELAASRNFLCMQFIDGKPLPAWLLQKRSKERIRTVLRRILWQCWRLDRINLDHGELSHAPKHVIINRRDKPFIVDFESASMNRKPSNVTSICQFLFIGSETAEQVSKKLGSKDKKAITEALRRYKNERTFRNFRRVKDACGL